MMGDAEVAQLNRELSAALGYRPGYVVPFTADPAACLALIDTLADRGYTVETESGIRGAPEGRLHYAAVFDEDIDNPLGKAEGDSLPAVVAVAALAALRSADA